MKKFEEIQEIVKNFSYEKQQRKQQIADIELKRTQLAQKRNEKKLAYKNINSIYASNIEAQLCKLGNQISELGNQSQDLQNKLDARCVEVKKEVKDGHWKQIIQNEIDVENIKKRDFENFRQKLDSLFEELYREQKGIIEQCEKIEESIILSNIDIEESKIVQEININEFQPIGEVKLEEISIKPEIKIKEIDLIEEIYIEEEPSTTEVRTEEFLLAEEQQEKIEPIVEIEEEIITFEEETVNDEIVYDEKIRLTNIIAKIVSGEVVYKAQINNGETIEIYPIKINGENILIKDKEYRNKIKQILKTYAISEYKMLDTKVIKILDPTICEILIEFAKKYNYNEKKLIYDYAMSFSQKIMVETDEIPQITYNFAFIDEADISKKEKKMLIKNCNNARRNQVIEVIGYNKGIIKYVLKRIFHINELQALPETKI